MNSLFNRLYLNQPISNHYQIRAIDKRLHVWKLLKKTFSMLKSVSLPHLAITIINMLNNFLNIADYAEQGCKTRSQWDPARKRVLCFIQPWVKKYNKLLMNDGDFITKFKLRWTINSFATEYRTIWNSCDAFDTWQQYQIKSNKKAN